MRVTSIKRIRIAAAVCIAGVALVGGAIAVGYSSRPPTLNDPVRVEVIDHGAGLTIAVNPCLGFDVTEVQVVTSVVKDHVASDAESTVWEYRPQVAGQTLFQTAEANSGVVVPFKPLKTYPGSNTFGVYVTYAAKSAPRGFTDRTALTRAFTLEQSSSDIKAYQLLATTRCKSSPGSLSNGSAWGVTDSDPA